MKNLSIFLVITLLTAPYPTFGQASDEEKFIKDFLAKVSKDEKVKFDRNVTRILSKVVEDKVYSSLVTSINSEIYNAAAFSAVADYINPSDKSLTGQSYNEYLAKMANKVFQEGLESYDKPRIEQVVTNLTTDKLNKGTVVSSIIGGFISSTPILNTVTNIISGISSFFQARKTGIGNAITDLSRGIADNKLKKFKDLTSSYVQFYDSALIANKNFGLRINNILIEAKRINGVAKSSVDDLSASLKQKLNGDVTIANMQIVFPFDYQKLFLGTYDNDYFDLVVKADKVDENYSNIAHLSERAHDAINEYITTMEDLVTRYQNKLTTSEDEPVDLSKIKNKLTILREHFGDLKGKGALVKSTAFTKVIYNDTRIADFSSLSYVPTSYRILEDENDQLDISNSMFTDRVNSKLMISALITTLASVLISIAFVLWRLKRIAQKSGVNFK